MALLPHGSDNNATGGPAFKALFPNGLDAELRPVGSSQVTAAVALRERLNTQPAAAKVKAQVMDDFDKALDKFKSARFPVVEMIDGSTQVGFPAVEMEDGWTRVALPAVEMGDG